MRHDNRTCTMISYDFWLCDWPRRPFQVSCRQENVGWRRPINSIGRSPSRLERNEINLLVAGQLSYIHCYVEALLRWRWLCWRQPILGYLYSSDSFVPVSSGRATILLLLSGHLKALPPPTLLYYFFSFVNLCPCYTPSISSTQSPWV